MKKKITCRSLSSEELDEQYGKRKIEVGRCFSFNNHKYRQHADFVLHIHVGDGIANDYLVNKLHEGYLNDRSSRKYTEISNLEFEGALVDVMIDLKEIMHISETKEMSMGELFEELVSEIKDLNALEKKTVPEKFVKFAEEFGEFAAETIKMLGMSHKPYDRDHHVEEMADSLQVHVSTILSICEEAKIDFNDVLIEMKKKNSKWKEKIPHYVKENALRQSCVGQISDPGSAWINTDSRYL